MAIPRNEYPRPQFVRKDWLCLNGPWQFEIDAGDTGAERGLLERELAGQITVPFCPESKLSGVECVDFMNAVWYRRVVVIPKAWAGRKVLLHFQAVDYEATVWVNGRRVGAHRGLWCGFTCDLGGVVEPGGKATIVVRARDPKGPGKPSGKQSHTDYHNSGAIYTRTTGIWQTVWMEPVNVVHLKRPRITPDLAGGRFRLVQPITNSRPGTKLRVTLKDNKGVVCRTVADAAADFAPGVDLPIPKARRRLWCPEDPFLYDLDIELLDAEGKTIDRAASYAGLRSVTIDGQAVRINGRSVFQRLVLDQGYYPDGILTAPNDAALRKDIELSLAAGFNGARLHQKVFEERFLYHADRLGYLVWGEFGDWGIDRAEPKATYITQWLEVVGRDYNHPAIVGWCPLNETSQPIPDGVDGLDDLTHGLVLATRAMDLTRPVLDAAGYSHREWDLDIYDSHDYDQNPATFAARHAGLADGEPFANPGKEHAPLSLPYAGQPYFVSEFGGTWWQPISAERRDSAAHDGSWGYGQAPRSLDEFYARFRGLCDVLLDNPHMFGYCYTQLTDVFQEQNGIFLFNRGRKFDLRKLHAIQRRPAAAEKR
ncbi:MAG: sugar-binding domain-containing protein [Planctomycetota bacterium]